MKKTIALLTTLLFFLFYGCGSSTEKVPYTGPAYHIGREIKVTNEPTTLYVYLSKSDAKIRDTAKLNMVLREIKNDRKDTKVNVFLYDAEDLAEAKYNIWLAKTVDSNNGIQIEHNANYDAQIKKYNEELDADLLQHNLKRMPEILKEIQTYKVDENMDSQYDFEVAVDRFDDELEEAKKRVDNNNAESKATYNKIVSAHKSKRGTFMASLRKAYAKYRANELWEKDFKVAAGGSNSKTITFTNFRFATNSNVKEFHEDEVKYLRKLEFGRVNYKFLSFGEYTFYDLE